MKTEQKTGKNLSFREESRCAYFEDRTAYMQYKVITDRNVKSYHELLAGGYRRYANIYYRTLCSECSSCVPIRLEPGKHLKGRGDKRTLKRNSDLRLEIRSNTLLTPRKVELYRRYLNSKHGKEDRDYEMLLSHIHYGYAYSIEMDYFLGDTLIGVGIVDEAEDALSSNYFYYDTDYLDRRPGVLSILHEIAFARYLGKRYYYLGFYIEENPKMSYKKQFRPHQVLRNGKWRDT